MNSDWSLAILLVSLFLLARIALDLRERRWILAGIGAFCLALLLLTPPPFPEGPIHLEVSGNSAS